MQNVLLGYMLVIFSGGIFVNSFLPLCWLLSCLFAFLLFFFLLWRGQTVLLMFSMPSIVLERWWRVAFSACIEKLSTPIIFLLLLLFCFWTFHSYKPYLHLLNDIFVWMCRYHVCQLLMWSVCSVCYEIVFTLILIIEYKEQVLHIMLV